MTNWWESLFDADYIRLWSQHRRHAQTALEEDGILAALATKGGWLGSRRTCGYGRLARLIAERGATAVGVDQSDQKV